MIGSEYGELADPVPHSAYDGFTDAIVAPMRWSEDIQGVLGVGRRNARPFGRARLRSRSRRSRVSPRSRSATRRPSCRAHGRRASSAASIASPRCSGSRSSRSATLDAVAQAAAEALGGASAAVLMQHARQLTLAGRHELSDELAPRSKAGATRTKGRSRGPPGRDGCSPRRRSRRTTGCPRPGSEAAAAGDYRALLAVPVETPRER